MRRERGRRVRRPTEEGNCVLLDCYAACSGNSFPTFRAVGKELQLHPAQASNHASAVPIVPNVNASMDRPASSIPAPRLHDVLRGSCTYAGIAGGDRIRKVCAKKKTNHTVQTLPQFLLQLPHPILPAMMLAVRLMSHP